MRRPYLQFYPGDWQANSKLKQCSHIEKGVWFDVLCVLHDQDEYGVIRWPLKQLAQAVRAPVAVLLRIVDKGILKGADSGATCMAMVYTPRSGRKNGDPVTLIPEQAGPVWYSSRMVRDEYLRKIREGNFPSPLQGNNSPPLGGKGESPLGGKGGSKNPAPSRARAQSARASSSHTDPDPDPSLVTRVLSSDLESHTHKPDKSVCVNKSKFTLEQIRQYAWASYNEDQRLKAAGEKNVWGINNPDGWSIAAQRSGDFDALVEEWLRTQRKLEIVR